MASRLSSCTFCYDCRSLAYTSLLLFYYNIFFHHASNSRGQWAQFPLPRPRPIRRAYKPNNVHNVSLSPTSKVETTCPRNFSECVQKSITGSLYHNILCLSILHSTFCIHLGFFGKWAHLYKVRLPFLPHLLRPNLLRPNNTFILPHSGGVA